MDFGGRWYCGGRLGWGFRLGGWHWLRRERLRNGFVPTLCHAKGDSTDCGRSGKSNHGRPSGAARMPAATWRLPVVTRALLCYGRGMATKKIFGKLLAVLAAAILAAPMLHAADLTA